MQADWSLFGRIIVMIIARILQLDEILSHPLGPLPLALSTPGALPWKTNKAVLTKRLQKNVAATEHFNSASVFDGMHLVQRVKGDQETFGGIASTLSSMVIREGCQSQRIDVMLDTYQENSIKNTLTD